MVSITRLNRPPSTPRITSRIPAASDRVVRCPTAVVAAGGGAQATVGWAAGGAIGGGVYVGGVEAGGAASGGGVTVVSSGAGVGSVGRSSVIWLPPVHMRCEARTA